MKLKFTLVLLAALLITASSTRAAHLIGGELSYRYLGNDSVYEVTLRIYRDCLGGGAPFDNPAYVFVYDTTGTLFDLLQLPIPSITSVPATSDNPCLTVPPGICVEEGIYIDTVFLPPVTGGYDMIYQRCCRNATIDNLIDPGSTGSTYVQHVTGPDEAAGNSSPEFVNFPPIVLCADDPINFDHSAFDPDGDSLVYSLCAPFSGASSTCPRPAGPFTGFGCPPEPGPGPFDLVEYIAGFGGANPLPATPPLSIDPVSGLLTGTATAPGQFVVAVCVEEYRDGVLLGTHVRDVQFNVTECTPLIVASTPDLILDCDDLAVEFENFSTGADEYLWDFGVAGVITDTSTIDEPIFNFPDTGTYLVTLIANPGFVCADTAYAEVNIFPSLFGGWTFSSGCSGVPVLFDDTSFSTGAGDIISWAWDFGDGTTSTDTDPEYQYANGGLYNVSLTVTTDKGCTETINQNVDVQPGPDAQFAFDDVCADETAFFDNLTTISSGTILVGYTWYFGDGDISNDEDAEHDYPGPGDYEVLLVAETTSGCIDSLSDSIRIGIVPIADAGPGDSVEFLTPVVLDGSGDGFYSWTPTDGLSDPNTQDPIFDGSETTTFILEVTSIDGCTDYDTVTIFVYPKEILEMPTAFSPNGDGVNDEFAILWNDIAVLDEFSIYNRWGELVYSSNNLERGWDGRVNGKDQEVGSYVYVIRATGDLGQPFERRGVFYLVR